jgi:hypothetical protein
MTACNQLGDGVQLGDGSVQLGSSSRAQPQRPFT